MTSSPGAAMPASLPQLLIVWHSRTGAAKAMALAAKAGAASAQGCETKLVHATRASAETLLGAHGYLFVCPENLGSLSGAMKEMLDKAYYPLLARVEGRAFASIIAAGSDGTGALAQLNRIVTGWRLRRVAEPLVFVMGAQSMEAILARKKVDASVLCQCRELGQAMAEGLAAGIF